MVVRLTLPQGYLVTALRLESQSLSFPCLEAIPTFPGITRLFRFPAPARIRHKAKIASQACFGKLGALWFIPPCVQPSFDRLSPGDTLLSVAE